MEQSAVNAINQALARIAREDGIDLGFRRSASYRYYRASKSVNKSRKQDMYFYTVRKCLYKSGEKFISGIYRYNASKETWKATKKAGHAKKKDAIARASKLASNNA